MPVSGEEGGDTSKAVINLLNQSELTKMGPLPLPYWCCLPQIGALFVLPTLILHRYFPIGI